MVACPWAGCEVEVVLELEFDPVLEVELELEATLVVGLVLALDVPDPDWVISSQYLVSKSHPEKSSTKTRIGPSLNAFFFFMGPPFLMDM